MNAAPKSLVILLLTACSRGQNLPAPHEVALSSGAQTLELHAHEVDVTSSLREQELYAASGERGPAAILGENPAEPASPTPESNEAPQQSGHHHHGMHHAR